MAYEEPDLPVSGNAVSTSAFGFKVRNSIIWFKEQIDAILSGIVVYRRTGGSATNWTTVGTDIYTPTKSKLQICTGYVVFSSGSDTEAQVDVTFPVAYSDKPIVVPFFNYTSISAGMVIEATTVSATGATLQARKISGTATLTYAVACLALGDIA